MQEDIPAQMIPRAGKWSSERMFWKIGMRGLGNVRAFWVGGVSS